MMLAEAGCVFMALLLFISGVRAAKSICALRGSSLSLPCSAKRPNLNMKWFTVRWDGSEYVQDEISADGDHVTYNMSAMSNYTLTIKDVKESDATYYCCRGETANPDLCWSNIAHLKVTDLQVMVIPSAAAEEEDMVSLMCSTSCPLTESPAPYVWYRNGELLYEDWSPWFQELLRSERTVRYSCAIKGHMHLQAPEVSVDSVSSACFTVTYANGRMCSDKKTSEDEPCSITYPREVRVKKTAGNQNHYWLTCNNSCPLTGPMNFRWYWTTDYTTDRPLPVHPSSRDIYFCAAGSHEELLSSETCGGDDGNCRTVNYASRRICALQGSSVNISSKYSPPNNDDNNNNQQPESKTWYKRQRNAPGDGEELDKTRHRVFDDVKNHNSVLTILRLMKNDSAEYTFRLLAPDPGRIQVAFPGVTLVVTELTVQFAPSAVVTEGERVTLTCTTSCPLTHNTNYMWYLNQQPLRLTGAGGKHLVLDPVSSQHAGNYTCGLKALQQQSSTGKILTVQGRINWAPAAAGALAAALLIISIPVFLIIRRNRTSGHSPGNETTDNLEQLHRQRWMTFIIAQSTSPTTEMGFTPQSSHISPKNTRMFSMLLSNYNPTRVTRILS